MRAISQQSLEGKITKLRLYHLIDETNFDPHFKRFTEHKLFRLLIKKITFTVRAQINYFRYKSPNSQKHEAIVELSPGYDHTYTKYHFPTLRLKNIVDEIRSSFSAKTVKHH